jgi:hypothetical protein
MCDRSALAAAKPSHRSRISNGSALFAGVDGRTAGARRVRDVLDGLLAEVGDASESQQSLARRAATLSVWCEGQEAAMARGEPVDMSQLTTSSNALRRVLSDLGLTGRRRAQA